MIKVGTGSGSAAGAHGVMSLESEAHQLADRLPELVLDALRVASTVAHGIHGRRRPGTGETFWQFRQLESGDPATLIDWRRSASSDLLFVREREWEAAHTVWLWSDLSRSMVFRSHLAATTKRDRAVVLMLALAEMLVRGGERVGALGLTPPLASRKATTRLAEALAQHQDDRLLTSGLPPVARLARFNGVILISDFLDPVEQIAARLKEIAGTGVSGHLVQVLDPAEETLPYEGRAEFLGVEGSERWIADRAESLRERYRERLEAHRAGLKAVADTLGWSFLVHHTDRPPAEPLLGIVMRLQGIGADYRWAGASAGTPGGGGTSP